MVRQVWGRGVFGDNLGVLHGYKGIFRGYGQCSHLIPRCPALDYGYFAYPHIHNHITNKKQTVHYLNIENSAFSD